MRSETRGRPIANRPDQLGQVVPLMAGIITLVALLAVGAAHLGGFVVDRARAQNAADAGALAAAVDVDTRTTARRLAARNGAEVTEVRQVGPVVVVTVRVGRAEATAAAAPVAAEARGTP